MAIETIKLPLSQFSHFYTCLREDSDVLRVSKADIDHFQLIFLDVECEVQNIRIPEYQNSTLKDHSSDSFAAEIVGFFAFSDAA